jgi:hypothetical protein
MRCADIGILGFGKMPADCLRILLGRNLRPAFVCETQESPFSPLRRLCEERGIHYRKTLRAETTGFLEGLSGRTVLLSINNNYLFPERVVRRDDLRIVNFHNALLPSYPGHGLIIPCWVLFNGETRHGVTWHLVDTGIDTGPVLCSDVFDVSSSDTAFSLMRRCVERGVSLFERHWESFLDFDAPGVARSNRGQDVYTHPLRHRLHKKADLPGGGVLNPAWDFEECSRFLRSLDYSPFALIPPPRIVFGDQAHIIEKYRIEEGGRSAGSRLDGRGLDEHPLNFDQGTIVLFLRPEPEHA